MEAFNPGLIYPTGREPLPARIGLTQKEITAAINNKMLYIEAKLLLSETGHIVDPLPIDALEDPDSPLFVFINHNTIRRANVPLPGNFDITNTAVKIYPHTGQIVIPTEAHTDRTRQVANIAFGLGHKLVPQYFIDNTEEFARLAGQKNAPALYELINLPPKISKKDLLFRMDGTAPVIHINVGEGTMVNLSTQAERFVHELIQELYMLQISFTDWALQKKFDAATILTTPALLQTGLSQYIKSNEYKTVFRSPHDSYVPALVDYITQMGGFADALSVLVRSQYIEENDILSHTQYKPLEELCEQKLISIFVTQELNAQLSAQMFRNTEEKGDYDTYLRLVSKLRPGKKVDQLGAMVSTFATNKYLSASRAEHPANDLLQLLGKGINDFTEWTQTHPNEVLEAAKAQLRKLIQLRRRK